VDDSRIYKEAREEGLEVIKEFVKVILAYVSRKNR